MIEQRKHPRFRLLNTMARTGAFEAPVLDLSRAGMRIQTPVALEVGSSMDFQIHDANHRLEVAGRVQWTRPAADAASTIVKASFHRPVRPTVDSCVHSIPAPGLQLAALLQPRS